MNSLLRRPPHFALVAGLIALTLGSVVGAVLVLFQDVIYAAARREIIKRPEIHGFSGSEVVDQGRIAEVADQANTALRLLHSHSIGIGLVVLIAALAVANLPIYPRVQSVLCILITLGVIYPLGWAALTWLIPIMGIDALRGPVEWVFFVPFGGALIVGLLGAVLFSFIGWLWPPEDETGLRGE